MSLNYLEKVTEVYCFVSVDEGGEGVIGKYFDGAWHPFVCSDKNIMEKLKLYAREIGKESGKKIKIIRFTQREEIEEL